MIDIDIDIKTRKVLEWVEINFKGVRAEVRLIATSLNH